MEKVVKEVYPNAIINKHSPGYIGDLFVKIHGKQIHSQEKDYKVDEKNIDMFVEKLRAAVEADEKTEVSPQKPVEVKAGDSLE